MATLKGLITIPPKKTKKKYNKFNPYRPAPGRGGTTKKCENKNLSQFFILTYFETHGAGRVKENEKQIITTRMVTFIPKWILSW